jgi:hypothetical protein
LLLKTIGILWIIHYDLSRSEATGDRGAMAGYRCYILDAADHIVQAHDLDCESDAHAEATAEDMLVLDPYHRSVEVWHAARPVVKVERPLRLEVYAQQPDRPALT